MTTTQRSDRPAARLPRVLAGVALGTGLVCVGVASLVSGSPGALGAAIGAVVVIAFFGVTAAVLGPLTRMATGSAMLVALMLYGTKVLVLLAAAVALSRSGLLGDGIDARALGVTIIVCTLVVTVLEVVSATTRRQPLYDLGSTPDLGEER
ncbi:hypothetical protein [Mumia zhuanghuii]|uniref:ATP synthase protein I n=1 Tax=Mumia zhuanghuii TaxID=2585211 RepID=A0A5C4MK11_9ACTN|nr:hypothetical protein [Mumia zhuanghuii]TNC42876.1 hypothetical protein FHE65_19720 [Mumia zhuanghuii]TNC43040.1 hypothetical protein FHE65_19435 [Mumia zhuanghuii]